MLRREFLLRRETACRDSLRDRRIYVYVGPGGFRLGSAWLAASGAQSVYMYKFRPQYGGWNLSIYTGWAPEAFSNIEPGPKPARTGVYVYLLVPHSLNGTWIACPSNARKGWVRRRVTTGLLPIRHKIGSVLLWRCFIRQSPCISAAIPKVEIL